MLSFPMVVIHRTEKNQDGSPLKGIALSLLPKIVQYTDPVTNELMQAAVDHIGVAWYTEDRQFSFVSLDQVAWLSIPGATDEDGELVSEVSEEVEDLDADEEEGEYEHVRENDDREAD